MPLIINSNGKPRCMSKALKLFLDDCDQQLARLNEELSRLYYLPEASGGTLDKLTEVYGFEDDKS